MNNSLITAGKESKKWKKNGHWDGETVFSIMFWKWFLQEATFTKDTLTRSYMAQSVWKGAKDSQGMKH